MEGKSVTADLTVSEVLDQWPQTVSVFQRMRLACVGCTMASFDTLEDVAHFYHLDLSQFLAALQEASVVSADIP